MDSKKMAQKAAKGLAREPLEILKTAGEQVTGVRPEERLESPTTVEDVEENRLHRERELQDKARSERRLGALSTELADIHKQEVYKGLEERVSRGETVPLEDYSELTIEQKQVLKAQMEAIEMRRRSQNPEESVLIEPTSHPSRRFGVTRKQGMQRQQTKVEKPVQSSV